MRKRCFFKAAAVVYAAAVTGGWMFLSAYANSRNRLTGEEIKPAFLTVDNDSAQLDMAGKSFEFDLSLAAPDSRIYFPLYLFCPDELRGLLLVQK